MIVKSAVFYKSVVAMDHCPDNHIPQIAFIGRSNVGKSSVMNCLMKQKLARTSATPGKTRELNYYLINGNLYFVDMPGYGYAKTLRTEQDQWKALIEMYFSKIEALKFIFLIIDSRHLGLENDHQMIEYLEYYNIPFGIILSKSDKLSRSDVIKAEKESKASYPTSQFTLPFSIHAPQESHKILKFISSLH